MPNYVNCKYCKEELKSWKLFIDDTEIVMNGHKQVELQCRKCGSSFDYLYSDIKARSNVVLKLVIGLLTLVLTFYIAYYTITNYWGKTAWFSVVIPIIVGIPGLIFYTFHRSETNRINLINKSRRSRHISFQDKRKWE